MAKSREERGRAARSRRKSTRNDRTESESLATDLKEIAARLPPEQINELITQARALSDAQAGEGTPPPAPVSATVDSPEEVVVAEAGDITLRETEVGRHRAMTAVDTGPATTLQGRRDALWDSELKVLRNHLPRMSFVGRSIHSNTRQPGLVADYLTIYETLNRRNQQLLPESVRGALHIARKGPDGQTKMKRRKQSTSATSTLRKNCDYRIRGLTSVDPPYVETLRDRKRKHYRLTSDGEQLFDDWPAWNTADPTPSADGQGASGAADAGAR